MGLRIPTTHHSSGAVILAQNRAKDQQKCEEPNDVGERASFAGVIDKEDGASVQSLDDECSTEGEKERIMSLLPELQKEQSCRKRCRSDNSEQEGLNNHRLITFPDQAIQQEQHSNGCGSETPQVQVPRGK